MTRAPKVLGPLRRSLVLVDRGYDPPLPAYEYVRLETLDEVDTMLGI